MWYQEVMKEEKGRGVVAEICFCFVFLFGIIASFLAVLRFFVRSCGSL